MNNSQNIEDSAAFADNINFNTQTKNSQDALSPADAIDLLKKGNQRFLQNQKFPRKLNAQVTETAGGQFPFAAVLGCIDSRVPAEIVFDQGIGDIFNCRVAGNILNGDILGSLEFACKVAGSKVIVVMGHSSCGAVKGACNSVELGNLTQLLEKINPSIDAVETEVGGALKRQDIEFVDKVAVKNVYTTIENIKKESEVLNAMFLANEIDIIGTMYDVKTGEVKFLD